MSAGISESDHQMLVSTIKLAWDARERGDHPIGSCLVAADGRILAQGGNEVVTRGDVLAHAEFLLVKWALENIGEAERSSLTIYTSTEPCPLCVGASYAASIGRIVFATSAAELRAWRGQRVNTLGISSHEIAASTTGRSISISGPDPSLAAEGKQVHVGFWFPDEG